MPLFGTEARQASQDAGNNGCGFTAIAIALGIILTILAILKDPMPLLRGIGGAILFMAGLIGGLCVLAWVLSKIFGDK